MTVSETSPAICLEKKRIRTIIRERMRALGAGEINAAGAEAQRKIMALPEFRDAGTVFCYISVPAEAGTRLLIERCSRDGKAVYVPAYVGGRNGYAPVRFAGYDALVAGPHGIPQPAAVHAGPVGSVDLAIVPGVAFDRRGGRLGRGGGWYDRMLGDIAAHSIPGGRPGARCVVAGLGLDAQIVDGVPMCCGDFGMDMVVTEQEVIRIGPVRHCRDCGAGPHG